MSGAASAKGAPAAALPNAANLQSLIARRVQLTEDLQSLERQIADLETTYLGMAALLSLAGSVA